MQLALNLIDFDETNLQVTNTMELTMTCLHQCQYLKVIEDFELYSTIYDQVAKGNTIIFPKNLLESEVTIEDFTVVIAEPLAAKKNTVRQKAYEYFNTRSATKSMFFIFNTMKSLIFLLERGYYVHEDNVDVIYNEIITANNDPNLIGRITNLKDKMSDFVLLESTYTALNELLINIETALTVEAIDLMFEEYKAKF